MLRKDFGCTRGVSLNLSKLAVKLLEIWEELLVKCRNLNLGYMVK